jgi:signal transduction histidine kinase/ActR/RegA family two-component response regulator
LEVCFSNYKGNEILRSHELSPQTQINKFMEARSRTFSKYIWGMYGLTVVVLGGLLLGSLWYSRSQLRKTAYAQTHSLALALDEINRRQLEVMSVPLDYVTQQVQARGGIEKMSQGDLDNLFVFAKSLVGSSYVRAIFAMDKEGHIRAAVGPNVLVQTMKTLKRSYTLGPEFDYLKTQKNYTIITTAISPIDQKQIFILIKTLRGNDGRFEGIVGVTRPTEDMVDFYKTQHLPEGVNFTIFRDDGKIIYRFPSGAGFENRRIAFSEGVQMDSEGTLEGRCEIDGFEKIGYYKFATPYGAMAYVGYNTAALFSGWRLVSILVIATFLLFMGALIYLVNLLRKRQESLRRTLEEQDTRDDLIRQIQQKTEVLTGHDFLWELGQQISMVFGVRNVAIGVLLPEHANSVKLVVNIVAGELATDYVYDLKNTPFDNLRPGEFFVYPRSVSKLYTQDPLLSYRKVESCMGLVLQDSEQRAIGVMMIYSDVEMENLALKRAVLSVFAARAGAELERLHADEIRKEVEKLRKQIEERTLRSEKMEAIGNLAEGVAHDFNNILAIIMATTEKMLSQHKGSTQDQHHLEVIKKAGDRARHLVAQILIFSKKGDSSVQSIQIKKLFPELMDFLRSTIPAQIRLAFDIADCEDLKISADPDQFQQAFMNLCVNAARAIGHKGGEIQLSLRRAQVKNRPYIKGRLHYNGGEMERDEVDKVFDPFYAQDIGMLVVQRIIRNHQGFIEVKSGSGQGTDFDIFIPVATGPGSDEIKTTPFNFNSAQKVMIIDDEPEIGLLIKDLLEIEGLHVDIFVDPEKALQAFTELQSQYFLIISDLSMPRMSGVDFMRKVREINKTIPLILWSGYHQFLDEELLDLNVQLLSKPVDVQKLLSLIDSELSQLKVQDISKEGRALDSEPVAPT